MPTDTAPIVAAIRELLGAVEAPSPSLATINPTWAALKRMLTNPAGYTFSPELADLDARVKASLQELLNRLREGDYWFQESPDAAAVLLNKTLASISPTETTADAAPWPEYMSAADLAARCGLPPESTRKKLERLAEKSDCYIENESPRVRETRRLYRVADVRLHLS